MRNYIEHLYWGHNGRNHTVGGNETSRSKGEDSVADGQERALPSFCGSHGNTLEIRLTQWNRAKGKRVTE